VNAGGPAYSDIAGKTWAADKPYSTASWGYTGGGTYSTGSAIGGTDDDPLFQTERWGMSAYRFDVPNGVYEVELRFAEVYYSRSGARLFDVLLEDVTVLSYLDIYSLVGKNNAYVRTFTVTVTDGALNVRFVVRTDAPKINALRVTSLNVPTATPTNTPTPLGPTNTRTVTSTPTLTRTATPTGSATPTVTLAWRVNCAGSQLTDSGGVVWQADRPFTTGSWGYINGQTASTTQPIGGTTDPALYQTQRYNVSSYRFTVPNGAYVVTLKFAETYQYAGIGSRVFNVRIEGQPVLTNFDIVAAVGRFQATDRSFITAVSDGVLQIDFYSVVGPPAVNAIQVVSSNITPTPLPTPTNSYQDPAPTKIIEAESGVLTPHMRIGYDATASGGQYIYDAGGDNNQSAAHYDFVIPYVPWTFNAYIVWVKLWAADSNSDSINFSVNGGPLQAWQTGVTSGWQWKRMPDPPEGWLIQQGVTQSLRFEGREPNLKVDVILLTDRHDTTAPKW